MKIYFFFSFSIVFANFLCEGKKHANINDQHSLKANLRSMQQLIDHEKKRMKSLTEQVYDWF